MPCLSDECEKCGLKNDQCLFCIDPSKALVETTGRCVEPTACPDGTFLKNRDEPLACEKCPSKCETCEELTGSCKSCPFDFKELASTKILNPEGDDCIDPAFCDISEGFIGIHG
mmetsp:Transcript_3848/g.5822  ORF Transcript_3848/g.5822 Transcript_3848/m.5822 type:complete len:114 (-) Transcript_3848:2031-2372(-)